MPKPWAFWTTLRFNLLEAVRQLLAVVQAASASARKSLTWWKLWQNYEVGVIDEISNCFINFWKQKVEMIFIFMVLNKLTFIDLCTLLMTALRGRDERRLAMRCRSFNTISWILGHSHSSSGERISDWILNKCLRNQCWIDDSGCVET